MYGKSAGNPTEPSPPEPDSGRGRGAQVRHLIRDEDEDTMKAFDFILGDYKTTHWCAPPARAPRRCAFARSGACFGCLLWAMVGALRRL